MNNHADHKMKNNNSRYLKYPASLLLLLLLPIGLTWAQETDTLELTMQQAVEMAMEQNQDVQIAKLNVARANAQVREAKGNYLPGVNLSGSYDRNIKKPVFFLPAGGGFGGGGSNEVTAIPAGSDNSYNLNAQANLPVYNKQVYENVDMAKATNKLSQQQLAAKKQEMGKEVKTAYIDALMMHESLQVREKSLKNAKNNLQNVKNLNSQGIAPDYDVLRADVQVENQRPEVLKAKNSYKAGIDYLKFLIGMNIDRPVKLKGILAAYYKENKSVSLKAYSIQDNSTLKQIGLEKNVTHHQINLNKTAYYPTLSLVGNYTYQTQANNFEFNDYRWVSSLSAGLRVQVPLFSGLTRHYKLQQSRIELQKVQEREEKLKKSLSIQARDALNKAKQAEKRIKAQKQNVAQAKKGYNIAEVSYQKGTINLMEVNDAELALTQAKMNYLQAIYDYVKAIIEYEKIVNKDIL